MDIDSTELEIVYKNTGERFSIALVLLIEQIVGFLDQMGVEPYVDTSFARLVQNGSGSEKFSRLLAATGYQDDPKTFCAAILEQLSVADGTQTIALNGVVLPHLLLMAILELVLPGNKFLSIKTVDQLEQAANISVKETDRDALQKVIDTYPVRLSMHTIRQMRVSPSVAFQYLPFLEELDTVGHTNTWIGQFHQGLLEQMYQNRVIFLLNMSCPVYCRFCFRKHKESRNEENPSVEDVEQAIEHVRNSPAIKEVVVTGGDPFMSRSNMEGTIDGLLEIDHVQTLRLATRSIAYYPHLFLADDRRWLNYLIRKNMELQERHKRLEVATHFIHPDEISPQCLLIISELVKNGIRVYIQTPFLKDCNDQGPELVRLFNLLRGAGAELHYIYIPCSPIHGNSVYWSPISDGHAAAHYLRAHLSDRVIPRICTATPIGKMDWHTSGWAVEPVEDNENFIWIRSPYTPDYFKEFAPIANELENIRVNEEGTIDIQYMARIGDERLFLGHRPLRLGGGMSPAEDSESVLPMLQETESLPPSLVPTGSASISRVHETRVEIDVQCTLADLAYVHEDSRITDVVLTAATDPLYFLPQVKDIISHLDAAHQVNSVRLRSLSFNLEPQQYTTLVLNMLEGLNKLTIVNPLRLEIETQFLSAEEILPSHERLVRLLVNKGITVYNNTPLLGRINDTPEAIHRLAYRCREAGIEFHHLYIAGCPVQEKWNRDNPVALYDVVDIATRVRREGSGREVPRYIIRTPLGEVDFGLTSTILGEGGDLEVKLQPYGLDYYTSLYSGFTWPADVREDTDGKPILPLTGLLKTTDFPLS